MADLDFYDSNNGAEVEIDELFVSFLFPEWNDAILTAGKFDSPFGIERPQFWYRETGSTSLLFNAQPQEITGLMSTNRWNSCNLTFRTFVVNGFNYDPDNNQQPSIGSMIEYQPTKNLTFGLTNWWVRNSRTTITTSSFSRKRRLFGRRHASCRYRVNFCTAFRRSPATLPTTPASWRSLLKNCAASGQHSAIQ